MAKDEMKSNGLAEMRRSQDELIEAYKQSEQENARLRASNERMRSALQRVTRGDKPAPEPEPTKEDGGPTPGQFVQYLPPGGKEGTVPRDALVLENKGGGVLKIKVKKIAQSDVVLDDVSPDRWRRHD